MSQARDWGWEDAPLQDRGEGVVSCRAARGRGALLRSSSEVNSDSE